MASKIDAEDGLGVISSPYATTASSSDFKIINDPIHGYMMLDPRLFAVMDTPQVQRLRDLKQLGCCYFVFPGASHNRFEHSVGVSYLAGKMISRFKATQPELHITDHEVRMVQIAGLCHDLGHGPYSHLFDSEFLPRARPELEWTHEDGSQMMLQSLIDENGIDMHRNELQMINDMISGEPHPSSKRPFLYQIVANHKNSVDVDKFDYLSRDCHNLGLKSSYDSSRLMFSCRVIDDEVCYHSKEVYNIYEMFHTRYSLHKQVYSHRVVKAIEYMICDVLCEADRVLGISESVRDPMRFLHLTDTVLRTVEASNEAALRKAQDIMQRLRKRDLYKFVDEAIIPVELLPHFPKIRPEDIVAHQGVGNLLKPEDVIVQNLKIDYAMKERNPVDNIHFYRDPRQTTKALSIPKHKVSSLIPDQFQEKFVRVFARDFQKKNAVSRAFQRFLREFSVPVAGKTVAEVMAEKDWVLSTALMGPNSDSSHGAAGSTVSSCSSAPAALQKASHGHPMIGATGRSMSAGGGSLADEVVAGPSLVVVAGAGAGAGAVLAGSANLVSSLASSTSSPLGQKRERHSADMRDNTGDDDLGI